MSLKEIVSVTGVSGLKRVVGQRKDGLIVSDLDGNNKKFLSSRIYMFSPIENISIYTDDNDTKPLTDVLFLVKEKAAEVPPVDPNGSNEELRDYFLKVMPEHDQDKVKISDIKKLIKWYHQLEAEGLLVKEEAEETSNEKSAPATAEAAPPDENIPVEEPPGNEPAPAKVTRKKK